MEKNKNLVIEDGLIKRRCMNCKEVSVYTRKTKPLECPICHDKYWDKPKDERDLFVLQDQYFSNNRDSKILGQMYTLIKTYSKNVIFNSIKDSYNLGLDTVEERTEDLAALLLEKYLKDKDFKVNYSFGGLLIRLSKGILYNKKVKENDQNSSLNAHLAEKLTIESSPSYFINDPEAKKEYEKRVYTQYEKVSNDMLVSELEELISKIYDRIIVSEKRRDSVLYLIGLKNFFSGENDLMTEYYDFSGNRPRQLIENTKMFIRQYLIDRGEN